MQSVEFRSQTIRRFSVGAMEGLRLRFAPFALVGLLALSAPSFVSANLYQPGDVVVLANGLLHVYRPSDDTTLPLPLSIWGSNRPPYGADVYVSRPVFADDVLHLQFFGYGDEVPCAKRENYPGSACIRGIDANGDFTADYIDTWALGDVTGGTGQHYGGVDDYDLSDGNFGIGVNTYLWFDEIFAMQNVYVYEQSVLFRESPVAGTGAPLIIGYYPYTGGDPDCLHRKGGPVVMVDDTRALTVQIGCMLIPESAGDYEQAKVLALQDLQANTVLEVARGNYSALERGQDGSVYAVLDGDLVRLDSATFQVAEVVGSNVGSVREFGVLHDGRFILGDGCGLSHLLLDPSDDSRSCVSIGPAGPGSAMLVVIPGAPPRPVPVLRPPLLGLLALLLLGSAAATLRMVQARP